MDNTPSMIRQAQLERSYRIQKSAPKQKESDIDSGAYADSGDIIIRRNNNDADRGLA